jgi:thiol-disulfide isomerase/thioredoxin
VKGYLLAAFLLGAAPTPPADVKRDGAFGFPQAKASVLSDTNDLRLSVWTDAKHLYAQAVVWTDGDDALGESEDGRVIGDWSVLCLDADGDGRVTPNVDRDYSLNPWPTHPGLRYSVKLGNNSSTHLKADSKGRGAIRYLETGGKKVRVDSFLIPLEEIGRKPGEKVHLAYWASSPKPELTLNSVGFESNKRYYPHHLPMDKYHEVVLVERPAAVDVEKVPEGRDDKVMLAKKPLKPLPKVGTVPPEFAAADWLNSAKPPTLAGLKGRVVVLDFWATWCVPCVKGIPRLNKLHDDHAADGLAVLTFTDQSKKGIEAFMKGTPIKYVVGTGSELSSDYGVAGLPHAFVIGRDGKLLWEGDPDDKEFEKQIKAALAAK